MTTTNFEPGCYFDSHHGHYNVPRVIEFAGLHGFVIDAEVQLALDAYDEHCYDEDFPDELLLDVSDEAIVFLNDQHAVAGHVWKWNEGDFGLYPVDNDEAVTQ